MAKNLSNRKPNMKNLRPNCVKMTIKKQGLNLQVVTLDNGEKVRVSVKEARTMKKAA